ncbi:MAG: CoA-binding protein [Thermoleophilia bacterium]|nr:CoA-binding protein [Thermoleophilia bacterium]
MARLAGIAQGAPSDEIREVLLHYRRLAVVGLSARPSRPSYRVAVHMRAAGYDITPVNPRCREVFEIPCVPDLAGTAELGPIEIVDIFRRVEEIPAVVDEAIAVGARVIWMQLGLVHEEAAATASEAGLRVVMDRCIKMEHTRFFGGLNNVGLATGVIGSKRWQPFR